ncbi:MAG: hypothetical protein WC979_02295 [Candidatus Pacearchaeota archaeon]|jgi:tRNA nucleotidyltransferase/poly(A) polymerase|nr:hypothetical protein [Clostridia bacterium]
MKELLKTLNSTKWIQEIESQGKIFLVGGCVRDFFTKAQSKDIDLVVEGIDVADLIEILKKHGKCDLVGESFAVIKFKDPNIADDFDISVCRTDKKIGAGHKGFEIISNKNISIGEDLFRRDFTINSIAIAMDGAILDPFDGIKDITNRIIHATNPNAFVDDALRIVRAVQFAARFKFRISDETLTMMSKNIDLLKDITGERIIEEFTKIINKHGSVEIAFKTLCNIGFFETFGIKTNKTMSIHDENFKTLGDLMYLLLFFENDILQIAANRFKCDNDTKKQILALIKMHELMENGIAAELIAAAMVKTTKDAFKLGSVFSNVKEILDLMESGKMVAKITDLKITGDDIKTFGIEGEAIGKTLNTLFEMVLFGHIVNDHSVLMKVVEQTKTKWGKELHKRTEDLQISIADNEESVRLIDEQIQTLKDKRKIVVSRVKDANKRLLTANEEYRFYLVSDYLKTKVAEESAKEHLSKLVKQYEGRDISEKHLTFDQYFKVLELRKANDPVLQRSALKSSNGPVKYEINDPVWYRTKLNNRVEDLTGWISKKRKDGTYEVTTHVGLVFDKVSVGWMSGIRKRIVKDLSHIEVPAEIKAMDTKKLLKEFKSCPTCHYHRGYVWIGNKQYDPEVIKAELNTRENIPNKNTKKFLNKKEWRK